MIAVRISPKAKKKNLSQFEKASETGSLVTVEEIHEALKKRVEQPIARSTTSRLLKRHQWRKLAPRPRHPKSDEKTQAQFKQEFPQRVAEIVQARPPEEQRPVIIMSQDEARFGRINKPRRCWAPRPIRPLVGQQYVREYLYLFAAVCPQLGRLTALILPWANLSMMALFLQQVAEEFKDYFMIMLVDQAAWHTSKKLPVPANIRLLPQPPGSPELNPTEHLWEDLREHEMANRLFASCDDVETALTQGILRLASQPAKLTSMTNFPYLRCHL